MTYEVEAFGKIIEVPDDVPKQKAYEQIMANKHKLDPDYKPEEPGIGDKLNDLATKYLAVDKNTISKALTPSKSIANQAEASAIEGENTAAPQVPGAPVRQSTYNKALLNPQDNVSGTDIKSRIGIAANENIKGQSNQQELELLRTEALKPSESGFGDSVLNSAGRTIKGVGQVASDFFDADPKNAVTNYGQKLLDDNPLWVKSLADIKDEPFLAFKEASGNSVPSMAAMVGVGALGAGITSLAPLTGPAAPVVAAVGQAVQWLGPAAVAALPSYSGIRDAQIAKNQKFEQDAKSKAIAAIGASAVGAIEVAFGPQQWALAMLTKEGRAAMARKFASTSIGEAAIKGAALGAIQEGSEEIAQNPIEQLASYQDPLSKKSLQDTAFSGAMGAIGGAGPGAFTGAASQISNIAQQKSDRINAERQKLGLDKIQSASTVDEAIQAANETVSAKPVGKEDILKSADPTLADIERLTGLKPSEALQEQERILQEQVKSEIPQGNLGNETEIVLPDNTSVKAQWRVVDADEIKAALKEGVSQPRDRTRAASDMQIKGIANAPDYRRLSDSPVMDVGAPVIDQQGNIVAGNGRFEGVSQSHMQGNSDAYKAALIEDAVKKGINESEIANIKHPILVRQLTEPVDTRKMAIASNSGGSLQYSALEQAKIDSDRMKGIENLDVTDSGDIALTPKNLTQLKDSLGNYTSTEMGSLVDKNGQLSQEGVKRVRNAMLAKAYGNSQVLEKLVESTDSDMRNVLGALTKSAGHIINTKGDIKSLLEAVSTYAQLKSTGQPVDNFLAQKDAFSEGLSKDAANILRFINDNARSQKNITDYIKGNFREADTTSADMFEKPKQPEILKDVRIERLEKHLKDNGYDFNVEPVTMRDIDALDSAKKARKELAEKQAKFFKKKIVFIKADGKFKINGAMVPSIKDTIFIDIRSAKPFDAITAHELSHWMEQEKPEVYKSMVDSIKEVIINDAESKYAEKYDIKGSTKDDITKEIVADIMGDNFTEQSFWQKVAEINPESFKEIAAAIIKWLKNTILKAKANGMGSEQWVKDATKAQDIIANAVAQYTVDENKPTEIKDNKPRLAKQEKLPETININGIERPTTNSEGKPIYSTEEGVRNFWRWFGDSKVVDEKGRPLVVYHGTDKAFSKVNVKKGAQNVFWFSSDKESILAGESGAISTNKIMPLYVRIENPANWKQYDNLGISEFSRDNLDGAMLPRKNGQFDGFVLDGSQVKSVDNKGYFSTNDDRLKLSKTEEPQQQKPFNPNEDIPETKARQTQRISQDKFNRFNVVKEFLDKEKGIKLSENADVYKAEERYYGKVANAQEDFRDKVRNPLVEKIAKSGFKLPQVEEYLLNKHAQEANAQNRKLTGKEDSTAYGISDKEAQEYLAKAPKELVKLADEVQAITKATQKLRLDNGIETKERIAAMNGAYEYYVPVRGDAESQEKQMSGKGTGKGFGLRYKGKRRLGHEARNEAVIENIFQDYERAIVQVEKNRVAKSLALMAAEIQMPELISINQPVKRKVLQNQKAYGVLVKGDLVDVFQSQEAAKQHRQLIAATDNKLTLSDITIAPITDQRLIYSASPMLADNEVLVYMDGHEIRMQINDDLLARAYKNMGVEALGHILSTGRVINGWMSKVYTGYNPEFIMTNLQRDFMSGIINLTGEQGITIAAKAVANYPKSFATLLRYAAKGESTKWIDAYRDNGGNTGAAYLPDLERVAQDVKREYAAYQGVIANLKEGDSANALRAAGRKAFNVTLKYIEHLNQAGENAFRLATFKAMVDSGKSVKEAASMAKNVTVNFNRKGEIGAEMNAAYLFFNASVQGTAAVSHALFKGRHKYQAWGLVGGMMTLGYMMASSLGGFDDEDKYDEISDSTKSRNLIMSYGDGYHKIPIPYGHGFFYNAGRMYAEAQRKGELGKLPYQLMALAIEEFSPFNVASTEDGEFNSQRVTYGLLPTTLRIPVEIASNFSTFTGREMYPEKEWYKSEPDNEKMWRGTKGTVYDISAQYLASIGVEISPEVLKSLTRTTTGGSGAFVDSTISGILLKKEGAELETREIPFVRQMYGEATIQDIRARFGKAKDEVRTAKEKFDAARRSNDISRVEKVLNDKKELLELNNFANKTSEVIKIFRDEQDAIKLDDKYTTAEKRLKIKELEKQEEGFYRMFLDDYKKIDRSKLK